MAVNIKVNPLPDSFRESIKAWVRHINGPHEDISDEGDDDIDDEGYEDISDKLTK